MDIFVNKNVLSYIYTDAPSMQKITASNNPTHYNYLEIIIKIFVFRDSYSMESSVFASFSSGVASGHGMGCLNKPGKPTT